MLSKLYNKELPLIEKELDRLLPDSNGQYSASIKAMRYSLLSGGKRIRPILLLLFYRLFGGKSDSVYSFAAAVEMIHTYSLIHDDLPCMDNDDMRRGKPSCHKAFGEDTALLAGDGLLTLAFKAASLAENIPPERKLKAIEYLADMAGIYGMIGGQVMDLEFEKSGATPDALTEMYIKKTSCLLRAAAVCGAILGGADEKQIELTEEYANSVGLAFQIIDDILDCTADEKTLGKPIGSDQKNGKITYASLYGIENARKQAAFLTDNALNILKNFDGDTEYLAEITKSLLNRSY